jgi:hypothetical protein
MIVIFPLHSYTSIQSGNLWKLQGCYRVVLKFGENFQTFTEFIKFLQDLLIKIDMKMSNFELLLEVEIAFTEIHPITKSNWLRPFFYLRSAIAKRVCP